MLHNRTMSIIASSSNNGIVKSYFGKTIDAEIIKYTKNIINSKKLSAKNIIILIALLGLDVIRSNINSAIGKIIKVSASHLLCSLHKIKEYISNKLRSNNNELVIETDIYTYKNIYECKITLTTCYNLLCEYILTSKSERCEFVEIMNNTKEISNDTFTRRVQLKDISLKFNEYTIQIVQSIDCLYDITSNGSIFNVQKYNEKNIITDGRFAYNLLQMLPISYDEATEIYNKISAVVNNNTNSLNIIEYKKTNNMDGYSELLKKLFKDNDTLQKYKGIVVKNDTIARDDMYILKLYTLFNLTYLDRDYPELIILIALLVRLIIDYSPNHTFSKNYILFFVKTDSEPIYYDSRLTAINKLYKNIFKNNDIKIKIYNWLDSINKKNLYIKSKDDHLNEYFKLNCADDLLRTVVYDSDMKPLKAENAMLVIEKFIQHINTINFVEDKNDIDVFNVVISDMKKDSSVVKTKTIKKKNTDGSEEIITMDETPVKQPRDIIISYKKLNTLYKPFKTLYLKEADEFRLKSILSSFDNKRVIYENLGIPFKFNCLFYGPPGTGKTSAIKAIGSYLQKDLFYLDLSKINSDDDLNKIFSDINKNTKSNGIVVLEDIDCMSEVVLSRDGKSKKSNLTLSNLLNILDGTMTRDESIVIMTTNYYDKLDSALTRAGRMDVSINLSYCDEYQYTIIYKNIIKRDIKQSHLNKLSKRNITPAQFIYGLLPYIESSISDADIIDGVLSTL